MVGLTPCPRERVFPPRPFRTTFVNHAAHPLQDHDPDEIGGHRLLGRLGSGGQGTVFLGKDSAGAQVAVKTLNPEGMADPEDRKSTRLNSSHVSISYAVFCLKKKTKK